MALPFLTKFRKEITKLDNVSLEFSPPGKWYSTGNYALNRSLSGSYFKAIPQGRLSAFVGPSAAGKSFIICNVIREAQRDGAICLVLDSENALDPKFMARAGINVNDENLTYAQVVTIQDITKVTSEFLTGYEKEYGRFNKDAPELMIVLDSLGNCLTDGENEKFEKGIQTGDQGASAKNKKHLLRTLVSRLGRCNATFVFTDQVYPADIMQGDGAWAVTNGVKYSASQIGLITKLKLKEGTDVVGIRMRVDTYKSRFVKPGVRIELEVPYKTGLSSIEGIVDSWLADGIAVKEGHSYVVETSEGRKKFKVADLTDEMVRNILKTNEKCIAIEKEFDDFEENDIIPEPSAAESEEENSAITLNLNPGESIDLATGEITVDNEVHTDEIKGIPEGYDLEESA